MATAIPAAVGVGGSIIGGIQGKGAAKRQERIAREQLDALKPLLQAQTSGAQYSLNQSKPFIQGAGRGLQDLMKQFYGPAAFGDRKAIDKFLAPERRSINQGFAAGMSNMARFAPRGGGRVSSLIGADFERQGKLSDLTFNARNQAAKGYGDTSNQLGALGQGILASGLGAGNQAVSVSNTQSALAQKASENSGEQLAGIGSALGKFLGGFEVFGGEGYGKK